VEPVPTPRGPGRIILLNGASSSGKSTLAKALQAALNEPFLHVSCIPALAQAGNDLIVEHIIEFRSWRDELAVLLADLDVFLVGVHCAPDELDRRERARGDRRIGEGRTHIEVDRIHTFGPYDLEVDTTAGASAELIASILAAWRHRSPPRNVSITGGDV
jgi:chloramphenicol 3-O phosphotransferase